MKIEGTTNSLDHTQFMGADEVNLPGDGVPGYKATGEDGTDDEIEQQIQQQSSITPKFTP